MIKAGVFSANFEAQSNDADPNGPTSLSFNVTRAQLRQIAGAPQATLIAGQANSLTLHEDQLAQIRGLLTYTDALPEFNPIPPGLDSR